jgi:hypothetical protein
MYRFLKLQQFVWEQYVLKEMTEDECVLFEAAQLHLYNYNFDNGCKNWLTLDECVDIAEEYMRKIHDIYKSKL